MSADEEVLLLAAALRHVGGALAAGAYNRPIFGSSSALCGIGGAFRGCLGDAQGVFRGH